MNHYVVLSVLFVGLVVLVGTISATNATLPILTKTDLVGRVRRAPLHHPPHHKEWTRPANFRMCKKKDPVCGRRDKINKCQSDSQCRRNEACCFDNCNYDCEKKF